MNKRNVCMLLLVLVLVITLSHLFVPTLNFDVNFRKLKSGQYVTLCSGAYNSRRMGNQLFNFATLVYVAKSTGRRMYMPEEIPYGWIDAYFDVNVTRVDMEVYNVCPCITAQEQYGGMRFDPEFDNLYKNDSFVNATTLFICGYFQSWKYTRGIEFELRQMLHFRSEISSAVTKFFREQVSSKAANTHFSTVGIHVRRGDFLVQHLVDTGFTVVDQTYLNNAIEYYIQLNQKLRTPKKLIFVVCSEDLGWVKSAINVSAYVNYHVTFVYSENNSPGFDMCLLSRCDSLIISTGSFGWWAAWLGNGTTVYYKNYPRPNSTYAQNFKQDDYYPSNWLPML